MPLNTPTIADATAAPQRHSRHAVLSHTTDKILPTILQKAQVQIFSQSECKRTYSPVSPRMLCAGVPSGERDACRVGGCLAFGQTDPFCT